MKMIYPLNKIKIGKEAKKEVLRLLESGKIGGDGEEGKKAVSLLKNYLKTPFAYLTPSGTAALEIAVKALGIKTGEEVILPSFTMPSTANAVLSAGAVPVYAEIEETSFSIDPKKLLDKINKKTKAVIFVWYGGWVGEIREIEKICKERGIYLIEDAACALGSRIGEKMAGTFGDLGCFSFHETKHLICGEGGALVCKEKELASKIEIIRNHGTNREEFLRGRADHYEWIGWGGSYLLADLLAVLLPSQFKKINQDILKRKKIAQIYLKILERLGNKIWLPKEQITKDTNWQTFAIRIDSKKRKNTLSLLRKRGIEASFHYVPLHIANFGKRFLGKKEKLEITEEVADSIVRLPIFSLLKEKEAEFIAKTVCRIIEKDKE